jgi:predicted ferric reductase
MLRKALRTAIVSACAVLGLSILYPGTSFALSPTPSYRPSVYTVATNLSSHELLQKTTSSWPWYISRSSGLIAAVLLLLLALSGIGQLTGFTYRFMEPLMSWSLHRAIAISFGVCVCVHGIVLLFDKYQPFNIFQILVPFVSKYRPVTIGGVHLGSLYVALGIFASYVAALLIVTSLYWINTKQKPWRLLHYFSYVLVALVFVHGLYLGTDLAHGPLRVLWWIGGVILGVGIISRLLRAGTIHNAGHRRTQA